MDFEEAQQYAVEQREQHMLALQSGEHELRDFYYGLTKEQLETLSMILSSATDTSLGVANAAMHMGRIREILSLKFGRCTCGQEHGTAEDFLMEVAPEAELTKASVTEVTGPSAMEMMKKYNLTFGKQFPEVKCKGCGLTYPNLRDRMLKEPDDCHGCHMKSAQG